MCPTLCKPINCNMPEFPVLHYLLEFAQTHVHWVSDAIQPSLSVTLFSSCPQSSVATGSFPVSQLFTSGGQSIGASASVLLMNIQGWFSLELTGLISWLSKGSQESSAAPEFESINSLACSLLCGPILTSIHDYWESHSFDYSDFFGKAISLLFNKPSWFVIVFLTLRRSYFPAQNTSLKLSSYPESRKRVTPVYLCADIKQI